MFALEINLNLQHFRNDLLIKIQIFILPSFYIFILNFYKFLYYLLDFPNGGFFH